MFRRDPDMKDPPRWEVPVDDWYGITRAHHTPRTKLQALMEAGPGDTPERSLEEMEAQEYGAIAALRELDEPMRTIVADTVIGQRTLDELKDELGFDHRTQVMRLRDQGLALLREALTNEEDNEDDE